MGSEANIVFFTSIVFILIFSAIGADLRRNSEISGEKKISKRDEGIIAKATTSTPSPQISQTTPTPTTIQRNCTDGQNKTDCHPNSTDDSSWTSKLPKWMDQNKGILERTMYVLIVLTVIVVLYFLVKMIRLRRRRSKTRRYGVLNTGPGDNLEMTPLDQEDDEDDMTVFEVNGHRK